MHMLLSRVQIKNFRNFAYVDVSLSPNVIIIGENRVGKSNFIYALRLVLDSSLPDSARQLKISDIWDGHSFHNSSDPEDPEIEIHLDFTDFDDDDNLIALLTDYRLAEDHNIARLSYVFRKKEEVEGHPASEADFEFKVFGGGDETRSINSQVRRRVCLDVLHALRDAENDLGTWRNSPLRPLLEDSISQIPKEDLHYVARLINDANIQLTAFESIKKLEDNLRQQMTELGGETQDIKSKLGFTSTDPLRLFRAIRVFIDDGKRGINEASLGSANIALLTLKLAEFGWRQEKNERNFTLVAVEEPEAHLHPHLQRKIFGNLFEKNGENGRSFILTTHSPNIASITPLKAVILLKDEGENGTKAYSLAKLSFRIEDLEDLHRYLNTTRAELLFSRGVIFVEGDAEEALVPVFARNLGYDLDSLCITVCNVGGTNFKPYARLATALNLPFAIITDWDPREDGKAYGWARSIQLIFAIRIVQGRGLPKKDNIIKLREDERYLRAIAKQYGIFLNDDTLETEIANTRSLIDPLLKVLAEQNFGQKLTERLNEWSEDNSLIDSSQLMLMIGYVKKGRFADLLAKEVTELTPPEYIKLAIERVVNNG